jgi:hypothetical protein
MHLLSMGPFKQNSNAAHKTELSAENATVQW